MSWVALAVGTVAAVGGAVASSQQAKSQAKAAQAQQRTAADGLNFGQKPQAAHYKPVEFDDAQIEAILANLHASPDANELMTMTNGQIDNDALNRARRFIPNYKENTRLMGQNTNDLLNGRLPYDDVLGIVADRTEASNALGTPGGSTNTSLRDLGLSRLDNIKAGSGMTASMVNMAETINPVGRRMKPQDMFVNPTDRIRLAMEQNQLIQQSNQNAFNLEAGVSPSEMARSQLQLGANLQPQPPGVDWGAIISSVGGNVAGTMAKQRAAGGSYDMAQDPQLQRGDYGRYYTRPAGTYSAGVPKLSDQYSIPAY